MSSIQTYQRVAQQNIQAASHTEAPKHHMHARVYIGIAASVLIAAVPLLMSAVSSVAAWAHPLTHAVACGGVPLGC